MKGVLTIIPVGDAAVTRKELAAAPRLEALQAGIGGGNIETVPHFTRHLGKPCVAFCDEDGKGKRLPYNVRATELWYGQIPDTFWRGDTKWPLDVLVGPIVIVTGDEDLMRAL
jgi:hypothetical protein